VTRSTLHVCGACRAVLGCVRVQRAGTGGGGWSVRSKSRGSKWVARPKT
jgi:hypothetical protein